MALVDDLRAMIKAAYVADTTLQQAYGLDPLKTFDAQFSPTSVEAIDANIMAEVQASVITTILADKATIQNIVDNNHIGTEPWYVVLAKQFQWSETETYQLVVDQATGEIYYNIVNPADRIVTQAACVVATVAGGTRVLVKVAKGTPGNLEPLTDRQKFDLENYLRSLKIAGVNVDVVNEPADVVELTATIYHDPAFNTNLLKDAIIAALDQYSANLPYNGVIYRSAIADAILGVDGVLDVVLPGDGLIAIHGEVRTPIDRAYTTYSGYFNFKKTDNFPILTIVANAND